MSRKQSSYATKRNNPGSMMYGPGCCANSEEHTPRWLQEHKANVARIREEEGNPNLSIPPVRGEERDERIST